MEPLTARQEHVLRRVADGAIAKQIALELHVHRHTVDCHLQDIRDRLGAQTTVHAVAIAIRKGLIP